MEALCKQVADLEKSLRDHEEKEKHLSHLASFPELNPNPVLEIDSAGAFLYLNPAAKSLFRICKVGEFGIPGFRNGKF